MNTLVTPNVLTQYIDNYSENEYKVQWELLKLYQNNTDDPRLYSESAYDGEWIREIMVDVLGYPKHSVSREYWTINGKGKKEERIDGVIYNNDKKTVKIVIELKSLTTPDLYKKDGKLSPITQGAKYLFQVPTAELAIVSNFDHLVVFNNKEAYRQEFNLFTMDYTQFKEFYLLLSFKSISSGLTKLMISQSSNPEQTIDEDFYIGCAAMYNALSHSMDIKYADKLFAQFIALAILEDSAKLPINTITTIQERKDDFDHTSSSHWEVWKSFFNMISKNKRKQAYFGIPLTTAKMAIWSDISYMNKIKVSKNILDQLVQLSKYNLKSVPLEELLFNISKYTYNTYDLVLSPNQFELYTKILNNKIDKPIVSDVEALSFITKKTFSFTPLIRLYNEITSNEQISIIETLSDYDILSTKVSNNFTEYFLIVEPLFLEDTDFINLIKYEVCNVTLSDRYNTPIIFIKMTQQPIDMVYLRYENNNISTYYTQSRVFIINSIIILNELDTKWLSNYYNNSNTTLLDIINITTENKATCRFNITHKTFNFFDTDLNEWDISIGDFYEDNIYIYFNVKKDDYKYIFMDSRFDTYIKLSAIRMETFLYSSINDIFLDDDYINKIKQEKNIEEKIKLCNYKIHKLKQNSNEENIINILKYEEQLDRLVDSLEELQ